MKRKQKFVQAVLAPTLALTIFASLAPMSRPAEAAGGLAVYRGPDTAVTVSQIDPASVGPSPGVISPQSVSSGPTSGGATQPAPTATPQVPAGGSGTVKSGNAFQSESV